MKWLVLLLIGLVGDDGLPTGLEVDATARPDLALGLESVRELTSVELDGTDYACTRSPIQHTMPPSVSLNGPPPLIDVIEDDERAKLRFSEAADEWGCAEAALPVHLAGISKNTTVRIQFHAERVIETASGVETLSLQQLNIYESLGADSTEGPIFIDCPAKMSHTYFDGLTGYRDEPVEWTIGPGDCPSDFEMPSTIFVGFLFADVAVNGQGSHRPSQALQVTISELNVTVQGIRQSVDARLENGLDPNTELLGFVAVEFPMPDYGPEVDVFARFQISNEYGIQLAKIGGERLSDADWESGESAGVLTFGLPPGLIHEHRTAHAGPPKVLVIFDDQQSATVVSAQLPLAAVALLAPLAAAVVAQRNVNHFHRTARGRERVLRFALQSGIGLGMMAYLGVTFYLLVKGGTVGMAASPLPDANVIVYAILAIVVIGQFVVAYVARRREMSLVLAEFNELERTQAELERSNQELEQFAYVASHDLKEPLRMVAGYTQLLDMRYGKKLDKQGRQFLDFASQGANRLQNMVDDLLRYSRVRTDRSQLKDVDLNDVMTIVRGHLTGLIKDRDVQLKVGNLDGVSGEQGQLVQLLLNLVQNAVKFSPQDSPVVEVKSRRTDKGIEITVRDEGIGIEEKAQERVFDIFQRLHLREEYEGNGIGLAMCKKIVEQHGGQISVRSKPGKGSTFVIRLPDRQIVHAVPASSAVAHGSA